MIDSSLFHMAPPELHLGIINFSLEITPVIHCRQRCDALGGRWKACLSATEIGWSPSSELLLIWVISQSSSRYKIQKLQITLV